MNAEIGLLVRVSLAPFLIYFYLISSCVVFLFRLVFRSTNEVSYISFIVVALVHVHSELEYREHVKHK